MNFGKHNIETILRYVDRITDQIKGYPAYKSKLGIIKSEAEYISFLLRTILELRVKVGGKNENN